MATYVSLIDASDRDVHSTQELASIWGEIQTEFEDHEAEIVDSYAMLGAHDFLVIFDATDREGAYKAALTLRRHGLSAQTMAVIDTDDFARVVEDV